MYSNKYRAPGVYQEDVFRMPAAELLTSVPAFLGYTAKVTEKEPGKPKKYDSLARWEEFEQKFGNPLPNTYLGYAVRGFFENDGKLCYVVPLKTEVPAENALILGLKDLEALDKIDLVCAPDLMASPLEASLSEVSVLQQKVLEHCDGAGDRFAILDSISGYDIKDQYQICKGTNGARYYPWIDVGERDEKGEVKYVPPCGHVAGVYSRSDQRVGVHKAPANEILQGVLDLEVPLTEADQAELNPLGINCLRVFPGRGIRVWGARTLSLDSAWTYVNVRRLFLTAGRWVERNMAEVVFEPNEPGLWTSIVRDLTAYFNDLFEKGALKGRTAREAFYVKCDAETNPPEVREVGNLVVEIGLAPAVPSEFIVVQIIHGASGVTITS
jgi:Bacteriophage tail sheath protein